MWSKYFVIFSGFLLLFGIQKSTCARSIDHQFPLGTIGCLFVDTDTLCGENSRCIDDFLFGTCAGDGVPENFAYTLSKHDLKKLGTELTKLKDNRLSWLDGYTQCIIQNVILSLSFQEPFSKQICYDLLEDWEGETENEIASIIQELEGEAINPNLALGGQDVYPMSRSQKRDEIIRVHKYFDKSKAIHKRLMEPQTVDSGYLSYYPKDDLVDLGLADPQYYPEVDLPPNEMGWEDSGLSLSDYQMVRDYLEANRGRDLSPGYDDVYAPILGDTQEGGFGGYYGNDLEDDLGPGYEWNDNGEISEMTSALATQSDGDRQESLQEGPKDDSLPPYYANLLDKLVIGEAQPENLTDDELGFLLPFVTKILARMSDLGLADNIEEEEQKEMEEGEEEIPLQMAAEEALETEMKLDPNSIPYGTEEEDMSDLEGVNNLEVNPAEPGEPMENLDLDLLNDELDPNTAIGDDTVVVKKNDVLSGLHEAVKKSDVINTNIVYIEMDHKLTDADADKMMEVVEKDLKANPGALENYIIEGNTLKINVDSILAGVNAQQVAKQADTHRLDIEKATGYRFLGTGIGDENTIEYKGSDDRYFVLTFVLCGCIAGILLAVVVIYLIKRNTRSKEKLQQIATVEGNDAASKDYQDLCRQRMQSKSSEKPEPLHAASRISSVSESQVRSPSSRSSTSSWSEEPVNSNMDISTGHIVLSYMEDHLKNKDRLDREWEAMCAYEADPSSTKVAEDQANMRKNRYGDVLPYDHSRVVLQSSTNVSGSDYINASSITDHDPRNPAYIATQGPLPHTVADFWQMVWEQGSVVIVMLSKLTEDGEAKCHRYWPEEGSDLYHIYEVHLVSEHIWCEDYLVRSFYLKNLQTSETRTVTQFHFLTWPDLGIPGSIKALLDFRRKVNKSYRGRSCPIVVHCSDGCGRTGTYSLVDMVLNRMAKGAKEIDIAATLEHIRDQRMNMVKTKEQFQFALAAVAEEVHAILKALPQ